MTRVDSDDDVMLVAQGCVVVTYAQFLERRQRRDRVARALARGDGHHTHDGKLAATADGVFGASPSRNWTPSASHRGTSQERRLTS